MNYELAKKLKDAGFVGSSLYVERKMKDNKGFIIELPEGAPTLAELIAACGERFASLDRLWKDMWVVYAFEGTEHKRRRDITIQIQGSTPEEAMVKLWLALHKETSSPL